MHPDVRTGKKTEDEVIMEFMETFERHHQLASDGKSTKGDGYVSLEEFIEYYNNISCNIENDSYFDLMISNAWNLEGNNPANMPYAGTAKKVAQVNAREAYRQDHHRNLFGTDNQTPFEKGGKKVGNQWQTSQKAAMVAPEIQGQGAAGSQSIHN